MAGKSGVESRFCSNTMILNMGKRRGWDLNPRWSYPHSGFRDRPVQPLQHLSGSKDALFYYESSLLRFQLQRNRVDAVSQPRRPRTIRKDVTQMRAAGVAHDFGAAHAVGAVGLFLDLVFVCRLVKTRPSAAGVKFRLRVEEFGAAAHAGVHAFLLRLVVLAGERALGTLFAGDGVLLRRQFLLPLLVGLHDFLFHRKNSCRSWRHSASRTPETTSG